MEFTKMHGLGNDFIIINDPSIKSNIYNNLARNLCNRHTGIGADGILLVLPSTKNTADIRMRIINSDGSEADMCGNGIRCFARYLYENKLVNNSSINIETNAGIIKTNLIFNNGSIENITVDMGKIQLNHKDFPILIEKEQIIDEPLTINDQSYKITSILVGVPHTIVFVDNIDEIDINKTGPLIEHNPIFPLGTNVNFVEIINHNEIKVRTWERGAGATLACGTGCCASVVASYLNNYTNNKVTVHLKAGLLIIKYTNSSHVYMTGPAVNVFSGKIN